MALALATNLPHSVRENLHYKAKQRITLKSVMRCFNYKTLVDQMRIELLRTDHMFA